jgi:hypothetical protein
MTTRLAIIGVGENPAGSTATAGRYDKGDQTMTDTAIPIVGPKRRAAFYVLAGLFSLLLIVFTGVMIPILPSVVTGWFNPNQFGIHQLHEMNAGALNWLVLAGMLVQLNRPERKIAALQMTNLVVLVSIVVSLVAGTFFPPTLLFLLFTAGAAWLHPRREEMLRLGRLGNPELLALAALAAVPLAIYSAGQISLQRGAAAGDSHAAFAHYAGAGVLAITILLVALLASFKTTGWRIPARGAGFLAIFFGLTSMVFPGQASSVGMLWGSLSILWGIAFIGAAEWVRFKGQRA